MKTGDWATADLVKYLVSIKDKLSGLELDRLKATSAFRKEGETNSNSTRYKASDLYEPQESLRQLSLPILDWGTNMKWKNGSVEGTSGYTSAYRSSLTNSFSTIPYVHRLATIPAFESYHRIMCSSGPRITTRCIEISPRQLPGSL